MSEASENATLALSFRNLHKTGYMYGDIVLDS